MTSAAWLLAGLLATDAGAPDAAASAVAPDAGCAPDAGASVLTPLKLGLVAKQWQAQRFPSSGAAAAIGTCSLGCLQGGATLPASGPGYEVIRLRRNRRYGHPDLVAYVRRLGVAAKKAKLGVVVVGDLSQPRGGPTPTGHRSHQTGLDADIGYTAPKGVRAGRLSAARREQLSSVAVIDLKTHKPTRSWNPRIVKLLALAASDPAVDRIFVNPAIKRMLCEGATANAPWQLRVRPWWAHHDHFHVRLKCPADSPLCVPQAPPTGDGCGAGLAWWFGEAAGPARTRKKQTEAVEPEPQLPLACGPLIGG